MAEDRELQKKGPENEAMEEIRGILREMLFEDVNAIKVAWEKGVDPRESIRATPFRAENEKGIYVSCTDEEKARSLQEHLKGKFVIECHETPKLRVEKPELEEGKTRLDKAINKFEEARDEGKSEK